MPRPSLPRTTALLALALTIVLPRTAEAQEGRARIRFEDRAPRVLELPGGSVEAFLEVRERIPAVLLQVDGEGGEYSVRLRSELFRERERIGREESAAIIIWPSGDQVRTDCTSRDVRPGGRDDGGVMVIWPSGDQVRGGGGCGSATWDVPGMLARAGGGDRLDPGEYEVRLSVADEAGRPWSNALSFGLVVP